MKNATTPRLNLQVKTEFSTLDFELLTGDKVTVGRADSCNVCLPLKSISTRHLEILWTGEVLKIKDLSSSNGTFRLPQDSPFTEADFGSEMEGLKLRLSKTELSLSWKLKGATETIAQTQVEAPEAVKTSISQAQTRVVEATPLTKVIEQTQTNLVEGTQTKGAGASRNSPVASLVASPAATLSQASKPLETKPSQAREILKEKIQSRLGRSPRAVEIASEPDFDAVPVAQSVIFFFMALLMCGASVLMVFKNFGAIFSVSPLTLQKGGFVDLEMLWIRWLTKHTFFIALVFGAPLAGFFLGKIFAAEPLLALLKKFRIRQAGPPLVLGFVLILAAFLWPFIWATTSGGPGFKKFRTQMEYVLIRENKNLNYKDKLEKIKGLEPQLIGSSLLYKDLFDLQRKRVLDECEGVGTEAPWENKKICLVLLSAVGIETFDEVKPALISSQAARAALILSLDGITRVIATEGMDAPAIAFFLNSLDVVGMVQETQSISELLEKQKGDPNAAGTLLRDLRKQMEARLVEEQQRRNYPAVLGLDLPGPLEIGI